MTGLLGSHALSGASAAASGPIDGGWNDAALTPDQSAAWIALAKDNIADRLGHMGLVLNPQSAAQIHVKDDKTWLAVNFFVVGTKDSNGNAPDAGEQLWSGYYGDGSCSTSDDAVACTTEANAAEPVPIPAPDDPKHDPATVQPFNQYSELDALFQLNTTDYTNTSNATFAGDHEMLITDNFDTDGVADTGGIVEMDYVDGEYIGTTPVMAVSPWAEPATQCSAMAAMIHLAQLEKDMECPLAKQNMAGRNLTCLSSVVRSLIIQQAQTLLCASA
ncbi:MAG: hypothetical protein V4479_16030 [Actinomycetota bacterium]